MSRRRLLLVKIVVLIALWVPAASSLAAERPAAGALPKALSADVVPVRGGAGMPGGTHGGMPTSGAQGGMPTSSGSGMASMNGGMTQNAGLATEHSASAGTSSQPSPCATSLLTDLFRPTEHARCLAQLHPGGASGQAKAKSTQRVAGRTSGN